MLPRSAAIVLGVIFLVGCADKTVLTVLPPDHPASPQAEEAPYTPLRDVFAETEPLELESDKDGAPDHEHEDEAPSNSDEKHKDHEQHKDHEHEK